MFFGAPICYEFVSSAAVVADDRGEAEVLGSAVETVRLARLSLGRVVGGAGVGAASRDSARVALAPEAGEAGVLMPLCEGEGERVGVLTAGGSGRILVRH